MEQRHRTKTNRKMIKRLQRIKYGVDFDESVSSEELSALEG